VQNPVEQGGLPRAQKAGQDSYGNRRAGVGHLKRQFEIVSIASQL
jgi:hypothetical protein